MTSAGSAGVETPAAPAAAVAAAGAGTGKPGSGVTRSGGGRTKRPALVVCSIVFAALALMQAHSDGLTYDESFHITSGLQALVHHDLRVVPGAPPLSHVTAALPLLLLRPVVPKGASWQRSDRPGMTADLLDAQGDARLHRMIFVARLVPILETIVTAWLIALLAERLLDRRAGTFAGLLWLANPFVLGFGHLDAMDVPAALTTVIAALAVLHALRTPGRRALLLVGVACGVAALTRTQSLLVLLAALAAVGFNARPLGLRAAAGRAATVLASAWATIGLGYFVIAPGPMPRNAGAMATTVARLFAPPDWLRGMAHMSQAGTTPGPALLLGHYHVGRWPIIWPLMMLLKLPFPTVAVLAIAPVVVLRLDPARRRELCLTVGLPVVLLVAFVVQQERPIGVRYLAAGLALAMVAASAVTMVVPRRVRIGLTAVVIAVGAASVAAPPAQSWTPPLLGPGYRLAGDSNFDWGQSYPALARWTTSHPAWVDYFGPPGMDVSGLPNARDLRRAPPDLTGWVAVSASSITVYSHARLGWLRAYCPVRVIDRTILVYRFVAPPDERARGGAVPPRPCAGRTSRLVRAPDVRSGSRPVRPVRRRRVMRATVRGRRHPLH